MSVSPEPKTVIIGLSGPSSSGKTSLARLLREIFNVDATDKNAITIKLFILHEDDFYKTDTEIPLRTVTSPSHGTRSIQDWDCIESLDLPKLNHTIQYIKQHGQLPADHISLEDGNHTAPRPGTGDTLTDQINNDEVDVRTIPPSEQSIHSMAAEIKSHITEWLTTITTPTSSKIKTIDICILDGFLLYPPPPTYLDILPPPTVETLFHETSTSQFRDLHSILSSSLDLKLFLPSTKQLTVSRRAGRAGYDTIEGFWQDPPGFVEDVVWPNYVRDHGWMFDGGGDVDAGRVSLGKKKEEGGEEEKTWCEREEIQVAPGDGEGDRVTVLGWAVAQVLALVWWAVGEGKGVKRGPVPGWEGRGTKSGGGKEV